MSDSERLLEVTPRNDSKDLLEALHPVGAGCLLLTRDFSGAGPRVAHATDGFLEFSGYTPESVRAQPLNLLLDPALDAKKLDELEHVLGQGKTWRSTAAVRLANASLASVELLASPLWSAVDSEACFVLELRQCLERDALMTIAEQRCRAATEVTRDGLILLVAQHDQAGQVVSFTISDANQRAAELLGAERASLRGRPLWEVAARLQTGECFLHCVAALETGRIQHATVPGNTLGMRAKWVRWHAVPLQTGVALCVCDVSWERELALQVARASRFESIGSLAVSIAHDFNNMLAAIMGFSELARDALPIGSAARIDVEQVINAADRATRLTRYLLAFGSRQPLDPQLVNIGASLSDLGPILSRLTGPSIDVSLHVSGTLSTWADPGQLEQAIVNLVVNSRDAMPQGGVLRIRAAAVTLGEGDRECTRGCEPGDYACIAIEDTGIGMDELTRDRIFEPFFTTKSERGGTGLGLASTYGFVKQSGGSILVDSEKGRGTTIQLFFPLVRVARRPSSVPAPCLSGPVERTTATILLVESDEHVRSVARRVLESNGFVVIEATDSRDADARLQLAVGNLDLLLTAMSLPGSSGIELASRVKQQHPGICVVLMSGAADMHEIDAAADHLGSSFVQKPFTAATLIAIIQSALGTGRRNLSELYSCGLP